MLLMTFGTARSTAEVPAYLSSVRGGREVPAELVEEFARRFERVGGSPLIEITERQAAALEVNLKAGNGEAARYVVRAGMRHSQPTIREGLRGLREAGAEQARGIVMSPQYSDRIMGGYLTAFREASAELGFGQATVARDWHLVPNFIEGLAAGLRTALEQCSTSEAPVVFSAHSLPRSVAESEPEYLAALRATAEAVAARAEIARDRWQFAYQSAGHTREEWLKPDLVDVFPGLYAQGQREVVVAPVQFLSDHLEVLYDIDVAAKEQAAEVGLRLIRSASLNDSPFLIEALAGVAQATQHGA